MDRLSAQVGAALTAADDPALSATARAEMLMAIAVRLQRQPPLLVYLASALELYERALALCPRDERVLTARIKLRRATALQAMPCDGTGHLEAARTDYQQAIPVVLELGTPEEVAEAELGFGLVLHALAGVQRAQISDAIKAYQRALRTFDRSRFPREFAIVQNNLATAFLALPLTDERSKLREALAVRALEAALEAVSLVDHPFEYAMLQHNLGNALQRAPSSRVAENQLRALGAYDEALKVRTRDAMPLAYANTIANKASCLWNLPDDADRPARGRASNLARARACYAEARELFGRYGEAAKARSAGDACDQIDRELLACDAGDAQSPP